MNGNGFTRSSDTRRALVRAATAARARMVGDGTVTRIEDATVYEFEGRPAAPSLGQFVQVDMLDRAAAPMLHVTGGPCRFGIAPGPARSRLPVWTGVPTVLAERAG